MLWAVEPPTCFATIKMPDLIHLADKKRWNMRDRDDRRGLYQQLIRRGLPQQMIRWIDGGLLVDLWDELDLPDPVREAWEPAIRFATLPMEVDSLRFLLSEPPEVAPTARVQGYEPLPSPPLPPPPRRSRFDPRPPPTLETETRTRRRRGRRAPSRNIIKLSEPVGIVKAVGRLRASRTAFGPAPAGPSCFYGTQT